MTEERLYTVDTVDGDTANLIDDQGRAISVSVYLLPRGIAEGIVVRVPVGKDGTHDWAISVPDSGETDRRRRTSQQMLRDLEGESGEQDTPADTT